MQDPSPPPSTPDARTWGLFMHLSALVQAIGVPAPLGPLVLWLIGRERHPFVDHQGKEALNFQITMLIAFIAALALMFILGILTLGIGFLFLWVLPVAVCVYWLVMVIVATVQASQGQWYRYPVTIRFVQ